MDVHSGSAFFPAFSAGERFVLVKRCYSTQQRFLRTW